MKLVRIIDAEKVRSVCTRYGFYTLGDCVAYDRMLSELCGGFYAGKDVTDDDIEAIAFDIVDHSSHEAFEVITYDTRKFNRIRKVIGILANECCITEIL